ncbi:MAG: metallophosphoesterase [Bacteroidales bacterium]|nr:metallophosphoesterase [Bacteroidales bacterium]
MFIITIYTRYENEDLDTYALRLYENKAEYDLNSREIAILLNQESDIQKDESAWRKHYASFKKGIEYERKRNNSGVATRILSISDCHVPFQLSLEKLSNYKGRVDILQLNGDIGDCQGISRFPKSYRVSPMEELIETRKFIIDLIEYIKPKKVVVTYGNHDIRFQSYLAKNLDSDLLELMPQTSLELIFVDGFKHYNKRERTKVEYKPLVEVIDDVEIEYMNNWYCQIGDAIFCHPKAFSSGIMKTAEKAMLWFRNEGFNFKSLVMAHTHRSGMYSIGNTTVYEQGAFCDTKSNNYSDGQLYNSQKEGFIYLCQDGKGNTLKDKTELVVLN